MPSSVCSSDPWFLSETSSSFLNFMISQSLNLSILKTYVLKNGSLQKWQTYHNSSFEFFVLATQCSKDNLWICFGTALWLDSKIQVSHVLLSWVQYWMCCEKFTLLISNFGYLSYSRQVSKLFTFTFFFARRKEPCSIKLASKS